MSLADLLKAGIQPCITINNIYGDNANPVMNSGVFAAPVHINISDPKLENIFNLIITELDANIKANRDWAISFKMGIADIVSQVNNGKAEKSFIDRLCTIAKTIEGTDAILTHAGKLIPYIEQLKTYIMSMI